MALTKPLSNVCGQDVCVFYHADADGETSAAIILEIYPQAWACPVNHGKPVKWDIIPLNTTKIVVVDFSFPLDEMKHLKEKYELHWIDHHPVVDEYKEKGFVCKGLQECTPGRSGAMLTWEYFHPDVEPPWVVKYVSDYDTWCFKYGDDTRAYSAAMGQLKLSPIDKHQAEWKLLFHSKEYCDKLLATGKRIFDYITLRNAILAKDGVFKSTIAGVPALFCNTRDANSTLFNSVDDPECPLRILFRYFANIDAYRVSVYSIDEEKYPANEICKKFGGNGHRGAAGFTAKHSQLPFSIPLTKDPDAMENVYSQLEDSMAREPLLYSYASQKLQAAIYSDSMPVNISGLRGVAINYTCCNSNIFYLTGLNIQYDVGVLWNICANGMVRHRVYSLHPEITVKHLQKKYKVQGNRESIIINDGLWFYEKYPIFWGRDQVPMYT